MSLWLAHPVPLAQHSKVMGYVADQDICQSPRDDRFPARLAPLTPALRRHTLHQGQGALPHGSELVHQGPEWSRVELASRDIRVLIEARERRPIPAADPQETIAKDALRVGEVAQYLLDAPLARRVPCQRRRVID